jgi:hypothetical protein
MRNIFLSGLFFSLIFISINTIAQIANPTRPSAADNACLTEYGYSELEIGYAGDKDTYSIPALLKFSVLKKLEAGVLMNGIVNYDGNEIKVGDPGFQLKYQILKNNDIAAAIVGRMGFSNSSSPIYTIYAVPTLQTDFAQFDLTAGTSFINNSDEYDNLYFYALAMSPKIDLPIGIFGEIFGESFSGSNSFYIDFGIGYPVTPDFVLDTGITFGLNDDADDWIFQIGLTKTLFKIL